MCRSTILSLAILGILVIGCNNKKKIMPLTAQFELGKIRVIEKRKTISEGQELTLMVRFEIEKKKQQRNATEYFQYQLGKKIKVVIDTDTLQPLISYYLPLINDVEKEIDVKFLIIQSNISKEKKIIIQDSIFNFNKVNISFK
jgi:hypothetical protein